MRILHLRFHVVLPQPMDLQNGALAPLLGFQDGRADGAAPGILLAEPADRPAPSENASRSAAVTPAFWETAPISATGAWTGRPLTTALLKLRATASHSPRRISAGE